MLQVSLKHNFSEIFFFFLDCQNWIFLGMALSRHDCDGVLSWSPEQRGSSKPHPFQCPDTDNREAAVFQLLRL